MNENKNTEQEALKAWKQSPEGQLLLDSESLLKYGAEKLLGRRLESAFRAGAEAQKAITLAEIERQEQDGKGCSDEALTTSFNQLSDFALGWCGLAKYLKVFLSREAAREGSKP